MTPLHDTALLTFIQWLSPAFPTEGYAYSHGLEWAMAAGEVTGAASLQSWISDVLCHGAGRSDAILLARGLDPDANLDALSDLARALAGSAEHLRETVEQGAAFALTTDALTGRALPPRPWPLAVAQAAGRLTLPPESVVVARIRGVETCGCPHTAIREDA